MRVLYVTADLFFSSRISSLASERGISIDVVGPALVAGRIDNDLQVAIIDLAHRTVVVSELVDMIRGTASDATIIAYGPHVDEKLLASAGAAGCDIVVPRSQFNQEIIAILERLAAE